MTVYRDKSRKNRWCYEFVLDHVRHRGVCKTPEGAYTKSKAEATDAETAARARVRAEAGIAKSGIRPGAYTLAQGLLRHISQTSVDASQSHIKSMQRISAELLRWFGADRPVVDITDDDTNEYRTWCAEQRRRVWLGGPRKMAEADFDNPKLWKELDQLRSASEVNHCLDLLRCALQAAYNTRNPQTGERMLPFPPEVKPVAVLERDPRPMPEAELSARLAKAPLWVVHAARLVRCFGLRQREAVSLDVFHLDHEHRCLRLKGAETKSGKDQALYGGREGWILAKWLARRARRVGQTRLVLWPGPAWFKRFRQGQTPPAEAWRPIKTFRRSWRDTVEAAGIERPHRFHDVRAAFITNIAEMASSTITKGLARHASMVTTEKYIKVVDKKFADAAEEASRRRGNLKIVKR